ncbi:hypothetical protein [Sphingomonas sp. BAUL-RG-20F-R05-02]|uniref:hypothetical protein n=1 Tax=Sphingomonas sp. BAUL-RG-20F-R05-02 TaxID=2914830 RepID=UPI001F57719C|nr:hypothetical protein [Sphingomonas sp. BAUL-RG-20F-R05-02]
MPHIRFSPGAVIDVRGAEYRPAYSHGRIQLAHMITGEIFKYEQKDGSLELPTVEQFQLMQHCGDAVTRMPRSSDEIRNYNDAAEWTRDQAGEISARALRMATACQILDERGVPQGIRAIKVALEDCWTPALASQFGPKPSASSVKNWRRNRGSIGNRHPRHMVPLSGRHIMRPQEGGINQQLLWTCVLEGRKAGRTVADIHADYSYQLSLVNDGRHPSIDKPREPFGICSERTVRRRFNELESDKTLATSIEVEAVKQDWSGAGKPLTADFVMQHVIVDHTWLDVHVVCPALQMVLGRPWLTLAIDVKSRAIVGHLITFHDPSRWSVSEVLRRIVLPKRPPPAMASRYPVLAMLCGKPGCLILDNAVEFRSHTLEAAARDAGFSVRFCPIKQPTYRAIGERAIKTLNDQITRLLPGRALTLNSTHLQPSPSSRLPVGWSAPHPRAPDLAGHAPLPDPVRTRRPSLSPPVLPRSGNLPPSLPACGAPPVRPDWRSCRSTPKGRALNQLSPTRNARVVRPKSILPEVACGTKAARSRMRLSV